MNDVTPGERDSARPGTQGQRGKSGALDLGPGYSASRNSGMTISEQALDLPTLVEADRVGGRHPGQAGHGHDLAGDGDDELGAGGESQFTDRHDMAGGRALLVGVGRE